MQETTLFLQLLYKNDFKDQFLDRLKGKYEKMLILAVDSAAYMKNYKSLDTNLDRGMHFHFHTIARCYWTLLLVHLNSYVYFDDVLAQATCVFYSDGAVI